MPNSRLRQAEHEGGGVAQHKGHDEGDEHRDGGKAGFQFVHGVGGLLELGAVHDAVEGEHQGHRQGDGDEIDEVIADLTPDVADGELTQHRLHPPARP